MIGLEVINNAIHCLKVGADMAVCEDCNLYECTHTDVEDIARVAIKALEKQIPKKPEFVDTRFKHLGKHISDGTILAKCYKCPNPDCGYHIFHTFDSERCCIHCGQALDWTE